MQVFDVSVEETVKRRFVRRVSAANPEAAKLAVDMIGITQDGALDVTEEVVDRRLLKNVKSVQNNGTTFKILEPGRLDNLRKYVGPIVVGHLLIDTDLLLTYWKGERVFISPQNFRVMFQMAINPGFAVDREIVIDALTHFPGEMDDRSADSSVKRIRKAFRDIDPDFNEIETVTHLGYRWKSSSMKFVGVTAPTFIKRGKTGKPLLEVDVDRHMIQLGGYYLKIPGSHVRLIIGMARTGRRYLSNYEISAFCDKGFEHKTDENGAARSTIKRLRRNTEKICPDTNIFHTEYGVGTCISDEVDLVRIKL
jgi:DNA-binding response OmpR family regulator